MPKMKEVAILGVGRHPWGKFPDKSFADLAEDVCLKALKDANVDCVVTVCPLCFLQFDLGQKLVERKFKEKFDIPTLTYSELLGLGMGLEPEELGLQTHRIKVDKLLAKIG